MVFAHGFAKPIGTKAPRAVCSLASDKLSKALDFGQAQGKQEGAGKAYEVDRKPVNQWEMLIKGLVGKCDAGQDLQQEKMQNVNPKGLAGQYSENPAIGLTLSAAGCDQSIINIGVPARAWALKRFPTTKAVLCVPRK